MKRSLIFCAIALVAVTAHTASAVVNVQLNLRYTDPNNEAAGGTWELLAGSDAGGIAGIVALVDNINNDALAAGSTGFDVFESQQVNTVVEVVTGSDLDTPATDVGLGAGTTGNVADDLFPGNSPAIWANNALLASGTFAGTRPAFLTNSGTLDAGANEFSGSNAVAATVGVWSVRGDSVATDGLVPGDFDRNGNVDLFGDVLTALGNVGVGTTWDEGDIDSSGSISLFDDVLPALNQVGNGTTPPAIGAVPEPTTIVLLSLASAGLLAVRRK